MNGPTPAAIPLTALPRNTAACVETVEDHREADPISRRLRELGFVRGEWVRVIAQAPFGADPLVVQVGFTRFALRRAEAARITVTPQTAP